MIGMDICGDLGSWPEHPICRDPSKEGRVTVAGHHPEGRVWPSTQTQQHMPSPFPDAARHPFYQPASVLRVERNLGAFAYRVADRW